MGKKHNRQVGLEIELIGADPLRVLRHANQVGIECEKVQIIDPLTVRFFIRRRDCKRMEHLAKRFDCRVRIKDSSRTSRLISRIIHRPVLLLGFLIIAILTLYLPGRILFVQVVGNVSIADREIIETASVCGIRFGASRKLIRSEKVKNALLEQLPRLQWLGVNTYGCTAVISVQEKESIVQQTDQASITSIVASRDGVIHSMTVSRGTAQCKPGQVVREGQLLVSGYSDCGICIYGTRSEAEIIADTQQHLTVVTPSVYAKRDCDETIDQKYAVVIGKKRINLYKGSGIYTPTCGKMYQEYNLTLPGGYQLPVTLIVETVMPSATGEMIRTKAQTEKVMRDFSVAYIKQRMIAGEIRSSICDWHRLKGIDSMSGTYVCREMIGRIRIEETIDQYGKSN